MISIYSQDNTEYTKNGDAVLIPTRCDLSLTINGAWQLTLEHPYDQEERYKYIVEGAVVQCDIKCIRELPVVKQRFRIYTYTKGLHGITAIGFPIAMESTYDAPIDNLVISGKTGAQAMALIQAFTNKYTLSTDVTKTASASMSNTNVNSAIASGNSNSFIGAWGGEILYSNYDYMVKNRLGDNVAGDHRIIYGRNLTNIEYKKDDSGLTTRIYPISEDGIRLNGTGYVDSPKISDYPVIHHRFMQAPYSLIDTDASSATATAQQTRTSLSAISTQTTTLSQGVDNSSYPPEYIKQQRADIVAAVQTMALNGVISTSLYNAAAKTISDAMAWMNNLAQPEWDWMGSYEAGWKYGNSDGYAVSQYIKIGKTWRYFGSNGNWQEPADSSNEWDWYQNTEETGKKYGDFSRYYAHNEYVFITLSGQLKQYWFNEEGWYEEDESGDSDYAWNGSGTSEDPWWFGESSSKYLKSCWAFIDGTYYFFDEYGYYDGSTKFDDYQWDWVDDGSRAWFGNPDHEYAAFYLVNQWCKIDGSWYYFDNDGYVYDDNAARANVISLYTTGMAALATTVSTQATALYTLLYSLMTAYAQSKFDSGVDMPYITITVNMADLSKTTEYAGYENLETVKLGDSVECIDNEHDISMTNRVIGLTYDVIRDYNSEVVLGNAAATVASIVGNANGQAVAGGFDTSAIESQLDSLQNKMGDFLLNGASVVTNGVGQLNLQSGENISISRDGRTLTISGEGGGNHNYYGTDAPSSSLGEENDIYCQIEDNEEITDFIVESTTPTGLMEAPVITEIAFNSFSATIAGTPTAYAYTPEDEIYINLQGLIVGQEYTLAFTFQYDSGTSFISGSGYNYVGIMADGVLSTQYATLPKDLSAHNHSFTFVAGNENYIKLSFHAISDNRRFTASMTNASITGTFGKIIDIWQKTEDGWVNSKFEGVKYIAGDNIQINDKTISATDTDEISELKDVEITDLADGEILKYDATAEKWVNGVGGGGTPYNNNYQEATLWENANGLEVPQNNASVTVTLNDNISNYDFLYIEVSGNTSTNARTQIWIPVSQIDKTGTNDFGIQVLNTNILRVSSIKYIDDTHLKLQYWTYSQPIKYYKILGVRVGGYLSPIIYFTEEREVGVWTDNKPLYQCSFLLPQNITVQTTWTSTNINLSSYNIEKLVYCETLRIDSGSWIFNANVNNNILRLYSYQNISLNKDSIITIRYTKTTDVAGSGSYNTLGVPNVHYSTDEQVIGTWLDGKPIYEKTFEITAQNIFNSATVINGLTIPDYKHIISCQAISTDYPQASPLMLYFNQGQWKAMAIGGINVNKLVIQYTKTTD